MQMLLLQLLPVAHRLQTPLHRQQMTTSNEAVCSAQNGSSSLPADGHLSKVASSPSAASDPSEHQEVQRPLNEATSGPATGGPASAGLSDLEQQMSRLAMTNAGHAQAAPAAGTHLEPPLAAASLEHPSLGTDDPGRTVQGEGYQMQQAAQKRTSGMDSMEELLGATMASAALQQQQSEGSSFSQSSGVMGTDLLADSAAGRDLPATQLQDSEMVAASQVQLPGIPYHSC